MKKGLIIFGFGDMAQIAKHYFEKDTDFKVHAFCLNRAYIKEKTFEGIDVLAFEEIENKFPPSDFAMFLALGYAEMNKLRERKFIEAKEKGYELVSYVSPDCTYRSQFEPGENCFIFEDNTIQPFVKIGDNVTLWSGNHIGHHSVIHDHNFISSHVVVSGHCEVESNCFVGVNATIGHKVVIAKECLIGAGAMVTKSTEEKGVYVPAKSVKLEKTSDLFNL
jgi:sugar O-acyltransferase (sialic acid O-acetyltransferase NeuD family)